MPSDRNRLAYCRPLGDSRPPDEAPPDAPPLWPERPWPVVPTLPWPEEPWRTFAPPPTFWRVVLEVPTVIDVPLRTLVRVEVPPLTATPLRCLLTTKLEGSL